MNPIESLNPFPGLRPFRQDEDFLFFGREDQTMELLERLGSHRFVAVVGTSGSGKSSLVRCGLLSELQGGKLLRAGSSWEIAVTHPGGDPLLLLAEALLEADLYDRDEEDALERLLATLSRSQFGLMEAVKQAGLGEGTNFLLVVDQFEEIFRFREAGQTQQEAAHEFISLLLEAVSQQEVPIYIVLTMRSDFIGECSQFENLSEMVNRGEFLIPRLTRQQYKRVIEGPIKVVGGSVTPRLLQRLLNDLGQQADQLPCLQHALMRTWTVAREESDSTPLDLEHYDQVGRMSRALSLHADEVYHALESDHQRQLCAGIFQALTVQESEHRGIRRPQRLTTLCQILEVPASELQPVVDAYRQHGVTFLMPPPEVEISDRTIIDISHESLMRVWTRLRHWTEEEAQAATIYRRLSESAAMHARGEAGLYRDPELGIALAWRRARKPNAAWAARYHQDFERAIGFLDQSQAAAEAAEQEREAARQHELKQAQQLAEEQRLRADEQRRAASRLRWFVGALAGVAAAALVAFVMAATARRQAVDNEARALAAQTRALAAAKTAEEALEDVRQARDQAQRASREEKQQRQRAETQTAAALRAQKQLETALADAEAARRDAEQARQRAEAAQQRADEDRQRAEEAERQAVEDRRRAVREKSLAEQNAELARRRERLFEKLLPLLQEHASEGVLLYARQLEDDGQPIQALNTFAEFCDLVLGEQQPGFLARELLHLDSFDLQGLDADAVDVEISVPPESLFSHVLMPAIALGERQLADGAHDQLPPLVARLHTYRARLLQQHPDAKWASSESRANMMFESFDRAAALEPNDFRHRLGRASARFRLPDRDLDQVLNDLDHALRLFPDPPQPIRGDDHVTDSHRRFAQLHHARANVLEFLALRDRAAARRQRLADAERSHREARAIDPDTPQYLVGNARTLRKQGNASDDDGTAAEFLDRAATLLAEALQMQPELPEAHNELGEVFLQQGEIGRSRQAFQDAVAYARQAGRTRGLYVSCCNLANAYTREPTDQAGYHKALEAAQQAIAVRKDHAEGHYYRGIALWKLGRMSGALEALSEAIRRTPGHAGALLAKCQIIFELEDANPPSDTQLAAAYADAQRVLEFPDLTNDERAKAYYVNSLGSLRNHVRQKSERALLECQEFALKATRGSRAYLPFAEQVYRHAAALTWTNRALQQASEALQRELRTVVAADSE